MLSATYTNTQFHLKEHKMLPSNPKITECISIGEATPDLNNLASCISGPTDNNCQSEPTGLQLQQPTSGNYLSLLADQSTVA